MTCRAPSGLPRPLGVRTASYRNASFMTGPLYTRAVRALAGIDVVSLAVNIPGPVMVARLAEYGASVTKIEPPEGDPLFHHDPRWYACLTTSQTILRLDLKSREGKTTLDERLSGADLLVTASRPSSLSRLGLDASSLQARFP